MSRDWRKKFKKGGVIESDASVYVCVSRGYLPLSKCSGKNEMREPSRKGK